MRRLIAALALLALSAATAWAQNSFPTPNPNVNAPGMVFMCPTAANSYVPCGSPGALSPFNSPLPAGTNSIGSVSATISTISAGTNRIGYTSDDPCSQLTKLGAPINLTASGQIIAGTSAKKTYICAIDVVTATAQNIALVEGTGSTCATNIFGLAGGTTAATGWNFSANSGIARGSGNGTIYSPSADTNAAAANVCLLLSSTGQTSGQITYVQQ